MSLKVEDLEHEFNQRNRFEKGSENSDSGVENIKVAKNNLIQQSMLDALDHMIESQETFRSQSKKNESLAKSSDAIVGPPRRYEKIIQQLEGDIRGHIRVSKLGNIQHNFDPRLFNTDGT